MNVAEFIAQGRLVAIFRGDFGGRWLSYAQALIEGDVTAIELTLNSPGALEGIRQLRAALDGQIVVGAGTVLSAEDARAALEAGAQFVVAPDTDEAMIAVCKDAGVPVYPGAYTPTEVKRAFNLGAAMVKLFPTATPEYIKAVRAPLDHIPLMVTGGVNVEYAAAFLRAGAAALGVGSSLVNGSLDEVAAKAKALRAAVASVFEPAK
jgi:2-dehydro-3-deoxyphosphogluconate aldolase/(4S)-4-hydroxy-2-oxoglutarate aldolase